MKANRNTKVCVIKIALLSGYKFRCEVPFFLPFKNIYSKTEDKITGLNLLVL